METTIDGWHLGGKELATNFKIHVDGTAELLSSGEFPNPLEFLLAAMNSCMMNSFVAVCASQGGRLKSLSLESSAGLYIRGFLGIDAKVPARYRKNQYRIQVEGDGSPEQFEKAQAAMQSSSPRFYDTSQTVELKSELEIL